MILGNIMKYPDFSDWIIVMNIKKILWRINIIWHIKNCLSEIFISSSNTFLESPNLFLKALIISSSLIDLLIINDLIISNNPLYNFFSHFDVAHTIFGIVPLH